jgi:hypothetical protein
MDWWDKKQPLGTVIRKEPLPIAFSTHIMAALAGYLTLLNIVSKASNRAQARELANLLIIRYVNDPLMKLARLFWEYREENTVQQLCGKSLNFKIIKRK